MKHCCSNMSEMIQEEKSIIFIPEFREYGIPILDGGSSFLQISFCPWCGKELPQSLRDEFFDIIEEMGINYPCPLDELPENMRSAKWWQEKKEDKDSDSDSGIPSSCRMLCLHRELSYK